MKAYVLSHKGVLISSPDVQNMTRARWIFEYHALKEKESTQVKHLKTLLINLLGLNLMKPENAAGAPKTVDEMTDVEKEGFIPLSMWTAHPEMLQRVSDQFEKLNTTDTVTADKNYERLVEQIDLADGDMEPIIEEMFGKIDEETAKKKWREEDADKLGIKKRTILEIEGDIE
jgi:hypothetical protein